MKDWCYTIIIMVTIGALATPVVAIADPIAKLKNLPKKEELPAIMEEIVAQGPQTIPALLLFLKEGSPQGSDHQQQENMRAGKMAVMNVLSKWKAKAALETLEVISKDTPDLEILWRATKTIGRIGGEQAIQILQHMVMQNTGKDGDIAIYRKRAALRGLGASGDQQVIPILKDELVNSHNDERTRIYAAAALGTLGNMDGVHVTIEGTKSQDPYIKLDSLETLGIIGSPVALDRLRAILAVPEETRVYRQAAYLAIVQIEVNQLSLDEQADYLYNELSQQPEWGELVSWGLATLQDMKTGKAKAILQRFVEERPEGSFLRNNALRTLQQLP